MDKSSFKDLVSKETLALRSITSTKTQLKATWLLAKDLKENADLLAAPIMRLGKKLIQSNPLNTETEGEGALGALELSALTGLGSKKM